MMTMIATILAITGSAILAGIAIALMRARCPRCSSRKVIENDADPREMRCLECNATWRAA